MNWKEFLKPTKRKIILSIISYIIILIFIYDQSTEVKYLIFGNPSYCICTWIGICEPKICEYEPPNIVVSIVVLVGLYVLNYILMCSLLPSGASYICGKFRKKTRKKK